MSRSGQSLQHEAALLFAALATQGACGPGTLTVEWNGEYSALGTTVTGLGGVCLSVFSNAEKAKAAAKLGATDFTVDSLSEALRILKNEVRQQRPVSVGLVGEAVAVAREMLDRGVQPEVIAAEAGLPWTNFVERGASALQPVAHKGLTRALTLRSLQSEVAETGKKRRERDAVLLAADENGPGAISRRWLVIAPRLFPRDLVRWYWAPKDDGLSSEQAEREAMDEAIRVSMQRRFTAEEEGGR